MTIWGAATSWLRSSRQAITKAVAASPAPGQVWRPQKQDRLPILLLALLPFVIALPELAGFFKANPMVFFGDLATHVQGGRPGSPYIDPNVAFTTQALGYRAARDWIHGIVPWGNPYSGVGLPLAAEYQGAAFFPLTLLLLLPKGMLLEHLALQVLAGWGTYALLRQMGLGRLAALTGGVLYGFDGTLSWFDHAPAFPVPFLPWLLLGIERAWIRVNSNARGGWRLLALSMGLLLLAGFPETAYLCGLFAAGWALVRLIQTPNTRRGLLVRRLALGAGVGLGLAAPQILAFFEYLPLADLGGHAGALAHAHLPFVATIPSLFAPYAFGPIFAVSSVWSKILLTWDNVGGYVDILLLAVALYGLIVRRSALAVFLLLWTLLAWAKTFGWSPAMALWNAVPGIPNTAFFRYAPPTWELAVIILAALGLDHIRRATALNRPALAVAILGPLGALFLVLFMAPSFLSHVRTHAGLRHWAMGSAAWAMLTLCGLFSLFWLPFKRRGSWIAALLIVDSLLTFFIPTLSNPRHGDVDYSAVHFFQRHLGLQRFYTLGPIQPNYGAYFGIASINHNYLPISRIWVRWIHRHLDPYANFVSFIGNFPRGPGQVSQTKELRRHLSAYEWTGVKYVVSPVGDSPFIATLSTRTEERNNRPLVLTSGQKATGLIPGGAISHDWTIGKAGVLIGNYGNRSDGLLHVRLCQRHRCVAGVAPLKKSLDNQVFWIRLRRPLALRPSQTITYKFKLSRGHRPVALWAVPVVPHYQQHLLGPSGFLPGYGLNIRLAENPTSRARGIQKVYTDSLMTIYKLPRPAPFYSALGGRCTFKEPAFNSVLTKCRAPSRLIRRELYFPGWAATINGRRASLYPYRGLVQSISLPKGTSHVRFAYSPPHERWAWLIAAVSLVTLTLGFATSTWRKS